MESFLWPEFPADGSSPYNSLCALPHSQTVKGVGHSSTAQ